MTTVNRYPRMTALARTFPTFNRERGQKGLAPGIEPFDAEKLDEACAGWSHGERCAAQFLLEVYHPGLEWQCGKFNLMDALGVWDDDHRAAFVAWVTHPWWP